MQNKRVRIVVLNFNRAAMTAECIAHVMRQTYKPKDVVVVDNNSSEDEFKKLSDLLPQEAIIVRSSSNLGYARGNNLGAKLDRGVPPSSYTMILNNDVILRENDICEKLISALEQNDSRVACSPLVNTVGTNQPPEAQIQVRRIPEFAAVLISSSCWLRRLPFLDRIAKWYTYSDERPYPLDQVIDCESINGSCFTVRNDFLQQIGYLDEGTFLYYEEIILGKQIKDHGKKACLVTSAVVQHNQGATSGHNVRRTRINMTIEMARSEAYYCRKYLKSSRPTIGILLLVRVIDISFKSAYQLFGRIWK